MNSHDVMETSEKKIWCNDVMEPQISNWRLPQKLGIRKTSQSFRKPQKSSRDKNKAAELIAGARSSAPRSYFMLRWRLVDHFWELHSARYVLYAHNDNLYVYLASGKKTRPVLVSALEDRQKKLSI